MKGIFLVWGRELELSRHLSAELGLELQQVYYRRYLPGKWLAPLRYLAQAIVSLAILLKKRPKVVYAQNPPVFTVLAAWLYCAIFRAKLAIDSHTAAFLDRKWIFFYPLFRFLARRAKLNTCHNYKNLEILQNWQIAPAFVVQFFNPVYDQSSLDKPMENKEIRDKLAEAKLPVMMVNRFANDDDCETVIGAARLWPEADFFITGNPAESPAGLLADLPANVHLTGYLQHTEYLKLMKQCRVILAFTTRQDTVLWSIREIMALRKPFVTTDSEVLRHYFGEVALFTRSDPAELKARIIQADNDREAASQWIESFLDKDRERWADEIARVKNILEK